MIDFTLLTDVSEIEACNNVSAACYSCPQFDACDPESKGEDE